MSAIFFTRVRTFYAALLIFYIAFVLRIFGILANEYFGFFDTKLASSLPVINFLTLMGEGSYWNGNFALQTFLNIPGFIIVEPNVFVLLMTNAFVGALAFLPLLYVFSRRKMVRAGIALSVILSFLPSAYNFSIFALRDILLYSSVIWYCAAIVGMWSARSSGEKLTYFLVCVSALVCIGSMRIELFAFMFIPLFGYFLFAYVRRGHAKHSASQQSITIRVAFFGLIALVIVSLSVPNLYAVVLRQINREGASPIELVEIAATQRFMRAASGGGGGSNIVDVATYRGLPWYARWGLQTVGLVVTPFPWQVTNPARLLAFIDSMVLLWMLFYAFRRRKKPSLSSSSSPYFWFLLTYFAGVLIMGVVVVNAGNAFRMRLPLLPFLIIPFCIVYFENRGLRSTHRDGVSSASTAQGVTR